VTSCTLKQLSFDTDLGALDLLGEVGGVGTYEKVVQRATEEEVFGFRCRVMDLDSRISSKQFAGRKKDEPVVIELEAVRELLRSGY